jgi:Ca2+-transporting ATPase
MTINTICLTTAEAQQLQLEHGPNILRPPQHASPWKLLIDQFRNVLVVILLIASAFSALLGHQTEAIVIAAILLFSAFLGFIQEFRAERAIEALHELTAPTATVIRDGNEQVIPAADVVPGDLLVLRAGDRISADAQLVESASLHVQESVLTGESAPVHKSESAKQVFAGTVVTMGRGLAVVVATGMRTEFGAIASMLDEVEVSRTPLQENLDVLGRTLGKIALVVVAVIVAIGIARGQGFIDMLIFGIALAVAVVPEALPAVVTISLALGVQRLVKRKALMRRLPAIETLGSTSVICSDKTGTLTRDEMTVRAIYPEATAATRSLLTAAVLCCDAQAVLDPKTQRRIIKGDPTEGALIVAGIHAGLSKDILEDQFPRIAELPFTSERKRMTTVHRTPTGAVAYSKGAPEVMLAACTHELHDGQVIELTEVQRGLLLERAQQFATNALRVLAVATSPVNESGESLEELERHMTFLGLVGMIDPPREEAAQALRLCEQAGIRVIMITGDHPVTAQAVARELGVFRTERVVTGTQLAMMDDEEISIALDASDVFARVAPSHKLRIVEVLKSKGHVVAMTGDGVNDAPALRRADIGVAMGITGTDVAKEAAAMTLTDDNFASIVAAVEEGRGIYGNIKKYLMFLLSSNIGEIGLMAMAALAGLPMPLNAVQLLYVNLATDGLPALALAVDPPADDLMQAKPRDAKAGIFTSRVRRLILIGGAWSTAVNLAVFVWARSSGRELDEAMTLTFVSLILIQFFKAYAFRSDHASTFARPFANRWLNAAIAWELVMLTMVIYLPILQGPFGTFHLTLVDWLVAIAAAVTILPVLEVAKKF